MPIYEYVAVDGGCHYCRAGFDVIQRMSDMPLSECPKCQSRVRRQISRFHACVVEAPDEIADVEKRVVGYEKEGMWSHAAELADKAGLEERARDDYKKAGYDF